MLISSKVKAGALQYTLFIAVIIVLFLSVFLTLSYLQNEFRKQSDITIESVKQVIEVFESLPTNIPYTKEGFMDFSTKDNKFLLKRKPWGIYDVITIESNVKGKTFRKTALVGGFQKVRPALYLKNINNPLVVVGNTKIEGRCFLPKQGVKSGNIAGHSYYNKQPIYGAIETSNDFLPKVRMQKLESEVFQEAVFFEPFEGQEKLNLFTKKTQVYRQLEAISLRQIKLTGNFIIHSKTAITLDKTAQLRDVILIAPTINIKSFTEGSFQAFATSNIYVGEQCKLKYPSMLVVHETDQTPKAVENIPVEIKKGVTVKGGVIYSSKDKELGNQVQVLMDKGSKLIGELYCDKNIELKGMVFGSVYTGGFIARQYGSIYKNHIYNGVVMETKLPKQYVGLSIEKSRQKVAKWVY